MNSTLRQQLLAQQRRQASLRSQRLSSTPTTRTFRRQTYQEIQAERRRQEELRKQQQIKSEVESMQSATYDNYEQRYNQLSPDAKSLVMSPSDLKKTSGYQNYLSQKRQAQINDLRQQYLQRKASGKSVGAVAYELRTSFGMEPGDFNFTKAEKRAMERGVDIRVETRQLQEMAKKSGFKNVAEFEAVSKQMKIPIMLPQREIKLTAKEKAIQDKYGTYYADSKTYVSPTGEGQSRKAPPSKALVLERPETRSRSVSGYEVIRKDGGMSVAYTQPGDIVLKRLESSKRVRLSPTSQLKDTLEIIKIWKSQPLDTIKTSDAKKTQSFVNAYNPKKNISYYLRKIGVDTFKIKNIPQSFWDKGKKDWLNTTTWNNISRQLTELSTSQLNQAKRIENNFEFKEIRNILRENPNASPNVLKKSIKEIGASWKKLQELQVYLIKTVALNTAISLINMGVATPQILMQLRRNPIKTITSLPPAIIEGIGEEFKRFRSGDGIDRTIQIGELFAIGKVFGVVGRISSASLRRLSYLSPNTFKMVNGNLIIRKAPAEKFTVRGKERLLKERVQKPSIKRPFTSVADFLKGRKPGQFKKFTRDPGLVLKQTFAKDSRMPFSQQIKQLSGKEVTAINAAAEQLTSWINRKKIIRKPIPGEEKFPKWIKNILAKLDSGKQLTLREIVESSKWMKQNVAPNITILERSLYADPASGFRISRLRIGGERTATLRDIFKGNFKLRGNKPQVLIFEKSKVATAPREIQKIANRIDKNGISSVSGLDLARIIKWQMKESDKWKAGGSPIYDLGRELEITAYGSYIKRLKSVGRVYIDGKKVTLVKAELYLPPKSLVRQIKLAEVGKLSKSSISKLEKLLSEKLGRKIKLETPKTKGKISKLEEKARRRADDSIPVIKIRGGKYLTLLRPKISKRTPMKRTSLIRKPTTRIVGGRKIIIRRTPTRTTTKVPPRITRRPPVTPPRVPPRITRRSPPITTKKIPPIMRIEQKFKPKKLSKSVPAYYVVEKRRGKFVKLYPRALKQNDAKDYLAYQIDNNLSRTAFLFPIGKTKKVFTPPKPIQGYFSKASNKLRPYKIRYGKKKRMLGGYIEKRKYAFDTPTERAQAKRLQRVTPKRRVTRKINPAQRKILIQRLKKARAVRMRNLKKVVRR